MRNQVNFYVYLDSNDVRWNLRADDLTQQSDECLISFLLMIGEARMQQPADLLHSLRFSVGPSGNMDLT